jgi:cardiolipin synthase
MEESWYQAPTADPFQPAVCRRKFPTVTTLLLAVWIGLSGCASVPNVEPVLEQPVGGQPYIVGSRGPLSPRQINALLRQKVGARELDAFERHLLIEQTVAETPLVVGNRTTLLIDGPSSFQRIFDAIRNAKSSINLEYYILEDVKSDGDLLSDLLLKKNAEGVAVNIIYDSFGSDDTPDAFFDRLRAAGIKMLSFNPVNPFKARGWWRPNHRDHRKIVVADGKVGIVGGINLSSVYEHSGVGKSGRTGFQPSEGGATRAPEEVRKQPLRWRDTDLEIDGPVVGQLQKLFLDHWATQDGGALNRADFFPAVPADGQEVVRIIGSTPRRQFPRYYITLLSAIRSASKSIYLDAGYFVPTHLELHDLMEAARRGVDVRLMLPGHSDSYLALGVQHSHYSALFKAGVKIYETQREILHSKAVVIDGVWSVVGSSNFDYRSVIFNDEVDAVVLGRGTASALEADFGDDTKHALAIDPEAWRHRPLFSRIGDSLARLVEWLL